MSDVTVVGAGAWGTALAVQAARAGNRVALWARDSARARAIDAARESPRLPGVRLPDAVRAVDTLPRSADMVLLVTPSQYMRGVLERVPASNAPLVNCAKGVETGTARLPLEILAALRPGEPAAVLTGPNFADEIARGLPAASVVAAARKDVRDHVIELLATPSFRLYGNDDPIGAQLGGAAKNVIAIAAGAVSGAGLGENARAALITRGLAELGRLAVALGGRAETVMGLSGAGDLLLTCTGARSRNFSLGFALGEGQALDEILAARTTVAEGVTTAPALLARAPHVDLPVCRAVSGLVTGRLKLEDAILQLLARPRRDE